MAENKKEPRKRGKKEKKGNKFALGVAVLGIVFVAGYNNKRYRCFGENC